MSWRVPPPSSTPSSPPPSPPPPFGLTRGGSQWELDDDPQRPAGLVSQPSLRILYSAELGGAEPPPPAGLQPIGEARFSASFEEVKRRLGCQEAQQAQQARPARARAPPGEERGRRGIGALLSITSLRRSSLSSAQGSAKLREASNGAAAPPSHDDAARTRALAAHDDGLTTFRPLRVEALGAPAPLPPGTTSTSAKSATPPGSTRVSPRQGKGARKQRGAVAFSRSTKDQPPPPPLPCVAESPRSTAARGYLQARTGLGQQQPAMTTSSARKSSLKGACAGCRDSCESGASEDAKAGRGAGLSVAAVGREAGGAPERAAETATDSQGDRKVTFLAGLMRRSSLADLLPGMLSRTKSACAEESASSASGGSAPSAAGGASRGSATVSVLLHPSQLVVATAPWAIAADGGPSLVSSFELAEELRRTDDTRKSADGGVGEPRLGFCARARPLADGTMTETRERSRSRRSSGSPFRRSGSAHSRSPTRAESSVGAALYFVPALHVGEPPCGCEGLLRVTFTPRLLPAPQHGVPPTHHVPLRPPPGAQLRTTSASAGARVGGEWPTIMPTLRNPALLVAWTLNGAALLGATLFLVDLACVAAVVGDGGGWNEGTTRAFGLSLLFSFCVADVIKALLLTFLTASLLPGFLSPRARVLRLGVRGLAEALQGLS